MAKLFSSFEEIYQNETRIENVLTEYSKYSAHTHHDKENELLHKHIHLVMQYGIKLSEVHDLNKVINHLIKDWILVNPKITKIELVGNFVKRLFVNTLLYHDYGKVNENFQIEKMRNSHLFKENRHNKIGAKHSILSTYIYLNIHLQEIIENKYFTTEEKEFLIINTLIFSNSILKHHSGFFEQEIVFDETIVENLRPYLHLFGCESIKGVKSILINAVSVFTHSINKLKSNSEQYFPIIALTKLNFSLLTASDYYATNEFMQDIRCTDFGLFSKSDKSNLFDRFLNNEEILYNGELMRNFEYFNNLEFENLNERNNKNLNLLRQKIAAEAITTLKNNSQNFLYYLEAPTGGGKTNISYACALELLKIDEKLNKIFYVFPFTTLITQTFSSIKKTLQIGNDKVIQLHAKSGFHTSNDEQQDDGLYGNNKLNYINNLFINYPITLLSHVKFFDMLKDNDKDNNYILHRLSNSIVIIDELQAYTPKHWDKIIFFLINYAKYFNIRFVIMSATLPKIDKLSTEAKGKVVSLVPNRHKYFTNANFKGRITFDFSLLGENGKKIITLDQLKDVVYEQLENYYSSNYTANGLIEFIIKKSASEFYKNICKDKRYGDYQKFLISGTILEPRRQEIIEAIKSKEYKGRKFSKSVAVTTQVVEAGVDIDMDIGFKDKSLVDSDEQLAGRVNRNAKKNNCKVFIFNYDKEYSVYGKDNRHKQKISFDDYKAILDDKNFDLLYDKVNNDIIKLNDSKWIVNLKDYLENFKSFNYRKINNDFQLIEADAISVFVPLPIEQKWFTASELQFYNNYNDTASDFIDGEKVFEIYKKIIFADNDFISKAIDKKQIIGIMSKFMFSTYTHSSMTKELLIYSDMEVFNQYGMIYLSHYSEVYSLENGIDDSKFKEAIFL